jgi:hypothetical protein
MTVYACNPSYWEALSRRIMVRGWHWEKTWDPIKKLNKTKRAGSVAQVVEHLPSKHEALSSNTAKKINKKSK